MTDRPAQLIDPVCGMTVEVRGAEAAGLLVEHEGRTYGFCRDGCRRAFLEGPATYVARADAETTATAMTSAMAGMPGMSGGLPLIDEGMRRWYASCSCCLGDTYPEIKAQLDAERAAAAEAPVGAGICEVAEAEAVPAP